MNTRTLTLLLTGVCILTLRLPSQTNLSPAIFPDEDTQTPESLRLVWPTTPGLRYEVQQSTNLQTWTTAPGFPAAAAGPAQQMPFATSGEARFFQVRQLDEQPPAIVNQYPTDGGFAVPRFSNLTLQLSDTTGINTNSIQLIVGTLGTFTLTNAQLTFSNNLLTFINGGSIPLGGWGSNVQATLIIADTLGYTVTNIWSFDLEVQPQVVTNLFVFGSPQAQRTGQQIGNTPTRALAQRFGPIPMGSGDPWTLELVASNRLELSYTNIAPGFVTNTYVCNLTPARPEDIFNRLITSISDDSGSKRLTLFTVEVPLTEVATNASVSISVDSRLLETDTNGSFIQMFSIDGAIPFPRIGYSLDGAEFDFGVVNLTLEEEHWWLTPTLRVSMEITSGSLSRFEALAQGRIESASVFDAEFPFPAVTELHVPLFDLPDELAPKKWMLLGSVGPVPVFALLEFDMKLRAEARLFARLNFRAGKREVTDVTFGLIYTKPEVRWIHTFNFAPPDEIPFSSTLKGEGSLKLFLEPEVKFLVYGLAGMSADISPSGGVVFEVGTNDCLSGRFEADVSLSLGLAGPAFESLNFMPEFSLPLWEDEWNLFGCSDLMFIDHPQSQNVTLGNSAYFFCTVESSEAPAYQWYFNNIPMADQTARTLSIPNVKIGNAGNYHVRVTAGGFFTNSAIATLTVQAIAGTNGMVWIPGGSFTMGDSFNESPDSWGERPVHTVNVSGFYMDKYEVTKALWDEVKGWALIHGYSFDNIGQGKATNHPVHSLTLYDMMKWCNARSEKEGRTPAYYTSAARNIVYRTGQIDVQNSWVESQSGGYQLPTEAEWEKAVRGGTSGRRFPSGNTISHSQANYYADSENYGYDVSPSQAYHPNFDTGANPYTSPVGVFAPNAYGVYDMAGNVAERCWDRWSETYYSSTPASDPTGPTSGSSRVLRGGSWVDRAIDCRTADRGSSGSASTTIGFRCVRRNSTLGN